MFVGVSILTLSLFRVLSVQIRSGIVSCQGFWQTAEHISGLEKKNREKNGRSKAPFSEDILFEGGLFWFPTHLRKEKCSSKRYDEFRSGLYITSITQHKTGICHIFPLLVLSVSLSVTYPADHFTRKVYISLATILLWIHELHIKQLRTFEMVQFWRRLGKNRDY